MRIHHWCSTVITTARSSLDDQTLKAGSTLKADSILKAGTTLTRMSHSRRLPLRGTSINAKRAVLRMIGIRGGHDPLG
jgi:hypothetical protein